MNLQRPSITLTGIPRTWPRSIWRMFYRLMRVSARESRKALPDLMCSGSAMIAYDENCEPRHVPISEWRKP